MNIKKIFCLIMVFCFIFGLYSISLSQKVKKDINKATVEELITIKGIGEKKAQAILEFIKERGSIKAMDELLEVKGIGPEILDELKANFEVKEPK